ncbi:zinc finger domain-containing protein [Streptomyces sp. H27-D2]|uniref:zinc finger domain-containing protein n=1 Tax=Streptomyces sp. H27-D2 TaxID=3046304 RepID=UPI003FA72151
MPDGIRRYLRAKKAPALGVGCPHCGAHAHRPCTTPSKRHVLVVPHAVRVSAWVRLVACCPACQVTPGVECHSDGRALPDGAVHARREAEALEVAA